MLVNTLKRLKLFIDKCNTFYHEYVIKSAGDKTFRDLNKEAIVFPLASQAQQCQGFSFLVVGIKLISNLGFLCLQNGQ